MVVFFDIDGTIIDEHTQTIPESTARAIRRLRENGHFPVINTGRPYTHIDPRVREMAFAGWVCGCGMEVLLDGKWIVREMPSPEVCRSVRDLIRRCNMQVLYEAQEGAVYTDGALSIHPEIVKEYSQMAARGIAVKDLPEENPVFMKMITYDWENCRREELLLEIATVYTCIDRGNTMVEMVLKGHSKAAGMERLLKALGTSREETLAIGDSTNDLPMFGVAKHTVCMGNGMEQLKERAEFINDSVLNDGIEKALRHYHLL
jgi:Cof subfamily protein (haloacid dehalogenase superfamily)